MSELRPLDWGRALERAATVALRLLLVAGAVVAIGWLLVRLRLVVLPFIVSLFFVSLLDPPAAALRRRGVPPLPSALLVFVGGLAIVVGTISLIVPPLVEQLPELGDSVTEAVDDVRDWLDDTPFGVDLPSLLEQLEDQLRGNAGAIAQGVLSGTIVAVELLAGLVLMLVLTFFLVKDGHRIAPSLLSLVPARSRIELAEGGRRVGSTIRGYLLGSAIIGLVDAAAIGLGLWLLDVPLVLPLMAIIWFGAFFPLVGAFVAGLLSALVALVAQGPATALIVTAITVAVQQLEGNILEPVVFKRTVYLHPVIVLVVLTSGAVLYGIVGAFLAVPVTASVVSIVEYRRQQEAAE